MSYGLCTRSVLCCVLGSHDGYGVGVLVQNAKVFWILAIRTCDILSLTARYLIRDVLTSVLPSIIGLGQSFNRRDLTARDRIPCGTGSGLVRDLSHEYNSTVYCIRPHDKGTVCDRFGLSVGLWNVCGSVSTLKRFLEDALTSSGSVLVYS